MLTHHRPYKHHETPEQYSERIKRENRELFFADVARLDTSHLTSYDARKYKQPNQVS